MVEYKPKWILYKFRNIIKFWHIKNIIYTILYKNDLYTHKNLTNLCYIEPKNSNFNVNIVK